MSLKPTKEVVADWLPFLEADLERLMDLPQDSAVMNSRMTVQAQLSYCRWVLYDETIPSYLRSRIPETLRAAIDWTGGAGGLG